MSLIYPTGFFQKEKIELFQQYGGEFIKWVGLERLEAMSVISASQASLLFLREIHEIDSRLWKGIYTARGVDRLKRPFIALRVKLILPDGRLSELIMTIYKRYLPDSTSQESQYTTCTSCIDTKGDFVDFQSLFPLAPLTEENALGENSWEKLAQLLSGRRVEMKSSFCKLLLKRDHFTDSEDCDALDTISLSSRSEENMYVFEERESFFEDDQRDLSSNIYTDCTLVFQQCLIC